MNKKITVPLAGLAIAAALAGCNSKTGSPSAAQASQRAHALATSSQGQAAEAAGKDALSTCISSKDLTQQYLISLALNKKAAEALARKCQIPESNLKPFVQAVLISASNAEMKGTFKTPAGRADWEDKVFPVILADYQAKK